MSTSAISNPLFQVLPKDIDTIIVPFCDVQTVSKMLGVCKAWKKNLSVQIAKETAYRKWEIQWGAKEGYPLKLLTIFQNCHFSIYRLPELNFGTVKQDIDMSWHGCIDFNDYVDFLNTRHLRAPIMRFKHQGRAGLVMCLQNRTNSEVGLCTLFRRFTYRDYWVDAPTQHNDRRVAPSNLLSRKNHVVFDALIPLLLGTDPEVSLIDPPPSPPIQPISLPPPVPSSLIWRLISYLYTSICDFFFWLYRLFHRL